MLWLIGVYETYYFAVNWLLKHMNGEPMMKVTDISVTEENLLV